MYLYLVTTHALYGFHTTKTKLVNNMLLEYTVFVAVGTPLLLPHVMSCDTYYNASLLIIINGRLGTQFGVILQHIVTTLNLQ